MLITDLFWGQFPISSSLWCGLSFPLISQRWYLDSYYDAVGFCFISEKIPLIISTFLTAAFFNKVSWTKPCRRNTKQSSPQMNLKDIPHSVLFALPVLIRHPMLQLSSPSLIFHALKQALHTCSSPDILNRTRAIERTLTSLLCLELPPWFKGDLKIFYTFTELLQFDWWQIKTEHVRS